jgi:putative membrane protein
MQHRSLEQTSPVRGADLHVEGLAVALDQQGHLDAGVSQCPDAAEHAGEAADGVAGDAEYDVARPQVGFFRRAAPHGPEDGDGVVDLGGVHAEPRPRRTIGRADGDEIVEDGFEQVDGDDHVDVLALAGARLLARGGDDLLDLQRADPQQVAAGSDQRRAAPIGMRRRGEDRLVQHVFPVAGEFLLGDDARGHRGFAPAGPADHHVLADLRFGRTAQRQRRQVEMRQRLHHAEAGLLVIAEHVAGHHFAAAERDPDVVGLGDQIADGEHDAVAAHQHAMAGALRAQRLRRERVRRNGGADADHRGQSLVQLEIVVLLPGLHAESSRLGVGNGQECRTPAYRDPMRIATAAGRSNSLHRLDGTLLGGFLAPINSMLEHAMAALFAFLHHIAAFTLVAALAVEFVLIRTTPTLENARRIIFADLTFGVSAGVILLVGLGRVFHFEKGAFYYFHTWTFIAKLSLFILIGLISIVPTREFLSWRSAVQQGQVPAVSAEKLRALRSIIHAELVGIVLIILCAALMAKGIGLMS